MHVSINPSCKQNARRGEEMDRKSEGDAPELMKMGTEIISRDDTMSHEVFNATCANSK